MSVITSYSIHYTKLYDCSDAVERVVRAGHEETGRGAVEHDRAQSAGVAEQRERADERNVRHRERPAKTDFVDEKAEQQRAWNTAPVERERSARRQRAVESLRFDEGRLV